MLPEYEHDELEFTYYARESMYDIVDDAYFRDRDSYLIYDALQTRLKAIPFGDYLKRYIYQKAELDGDYREIPLKEYQQIIRDSFQENLTPSSFTPTSARLSALSKNWLTQQAVNRKVVFLLGFGLNMSVADVNGFLTKALKEPEISSKDPFEVICWYCYRNRYSFPKFEQLWSIYEATPPGNLDIRMIYEDRTIDVRGRMLTLQDDTALISYLTRLKTADNVTRYSVAARRHLSRLYDEARMLLAKQLSESEDAPVSWEQVTPGDMERVLCSAVPTDKFGNLTPGKFSRLNQLFLGKRFSRKRLHAILSDASQIDRFDLITLQFFIFALKVDDFPRAKPRYIRFIDDMNRILEDCCMGPLYIANPYECFILMCVLSDDPMGTYADVVEMSYLEDPQV